MLEGQAHARYLPLMSLSEFAKTLLWGERLEDKLASFQETEQDFTAPCLSYPEIEAPHFPGRPLHLRPSVSHHRVEFPSFEQLAQSQRARGQILHFFANHELLALEIMAWVLIRFPAAPAPFRKGVLHTLREEQEHLKLYLARMKELGVEFGEIPVNDFFWSCLRKIESPLDYVTQMSLTFEQANLDFSLQYSETMTHVGDLKTAEILDRVYREEIGHVKHGVIWFNRWKNPEESEWNAYRRLLPFPLTTRRARGSTRFAADARAQAGLSEDYIAKVEVSSGSKGRPPEFWYYNPNCDAEIARGKVGFTPNKNVRNIQLDFEHFPLFLAKESDVVLVENLPSASFLKNLHDVGFPLPEFRTFEKNLDLPPENKIAGVQPWGWSPEVFARFQPWKDRLIKLDGANGAWCKALLNHTNFKNTDLSPLFSKAFSSAQLKSWLQSHPEDHAIFGSLEFTGSTETSWKALKEKWVTQLQKNPHQKWLLKAPYGTSGSGNRRVLHAHEAHQNLGKWAQKIIATQGEIIFEPLLHRVADLSMQIEIHPDQTRTVGIRRYLVGDSFEYRGTWLDPRLTSLGNEALRFLHDATLGESPLNRWETLAHELARQARKQGYLGPMGIDALLWRTEEGKLQLKPIVEINPRWTMGRIAIELEKRIVAGTPAAWIFLPTSQRALLADIQAQSIGPLQTRLQNGHKRIEQGILLTQDPACARERITALIVGKNLDATLQHFGFH